MSIKIIGTEIEALALKPTITGRESIPTGGEGLYRITTEQVKDYILNYFSKQSINLSNVDNTSDEDKPLSKAVRDALDNVLNKNSDNIVTSVNSLTGNVVLDASSFGLGNVDNTKDIDKPLSNANISSLFLKMDKNIFNEFENVFVRFQNRVEAWLANLDELAYRTHLLSLSNEERVFQLEKDLEDLRDYVDSEIHRIHHSLSNTQVDLVLKLVSDNFDTNLYHSLYLESVIQALQSYTDNSIALVNLELVELRKADALLDLQIRTLEQNTSQALTDLRNSFSDLKLSVDQQYVGLQILIEEAKDYIDSQIASIPVIITQFKNETNLLLKNLKDEVAGIIVDLDKKVDNVSTSIDDKINTNNEFYVASIYKATKKDIEDAINVLGSEFDLSFENFHEAVSDVKKEAENAALAAENLAAIRMAELTGLIESQTSHNLLIINAKVDEAEQTLEDTKNQLNAEADAIKAQITQERVDRDNAIKTAVDAAVTDLEIQLNNIDLPAVQLLSDKIDALNAKIEDGSAFLSQEVIDHINSEITKLDTKLQADIQFLSNNITLEQIDRLGRISKLEDGFTQEIIDRKAGNTALLSNIENYKVSNEQALANIQSGIEVTVDETIASSSKWTEIDTKFVGVNTSISSVTDRVDTLNTENLAQASQLETMSTTISNNDSTVKGLISTETNSRTTADSNMNSRIDTIQSEFTSDLNTTKSAINSLEETTVTADEALSLRINQNKTSIENVDTKVDSEITTVNQTITTLEGSVATQLERITSDYKDSDTVVNAAILRESTARAEANQALVERIEAVRSSFASGINIVPFIYTDPVEATTLPTINGVVLPITIPSVDLSKFFYTKYYWNLSPKPTGLTTVQFRSNSSDYNVQLTGGVKHIVSVYLRHNLATNKVVTLSLNTSTGFTVEKQVTVTPSSDFIRYFVVLTSPVAPALAYLSIKFTGPTTDVLSISRIMVEQKEGEPSVWTSGAIGSTSSYIDKINTLNNGQVALGERFESLSTDFNTKDANLRSLVATESESRSTADETLGRRVDSVQSSFDNTVFGGQNFWEFKDTGDTDSGTKTVVLVNDNLQHQRITINSISALSFSNLWSNLKVTGSPALPLDVPTSFSFDILPRFSKIRVFVYTWGSTNNTTNQLIEVIPNKWNRVNINNVIAKPDGSDSYTGMFFLRFLLSDNNIVEADLVGSVFEIKNIQLQQGTKATGYVPSYVTLQNEVVKTNAAITTEASTRASQNLATATRIDGITAEIVNSENRANSKILTEETARVEGDRVLTTRIQTLESTTDQLSIGASNLIPFSYNFKSGSSNNVAITAIADANLKLKIVTTNAQASATTLSNFLSVDSTTTYALTNISNTGIVTVVMSFWIKRENPSLAFVAHPEMRLNANSGFVLPFFVRGSPTQPNAYQLSYKFTSTTEEGFTTIAPAIRIKGPELASPLLIDRWKLELGTIATDWSDFKEGIVEIDKRTQASISNIQKTVTDNNTALTNELRRNTSLISDLPNQGINLLPYQTTVPKDTLWYKTSESVGLVYNSTVSSFKGINITTNAAALSTVTLNSTDTPFNVNLEVARYLFSVEALSTTDKHPLSVDLLPVRGTPGAIIKGASVELTTTLKQHTFLFSVPVRGKYDIVLNVNNALVANRLIHITKPMLEQQIGTNLKASAFKEGLVDSEFSLLPITSSESNIISQLKTTAADGVATASKVDTLTANVEREGLKVQGQITTINQSITNTEGNTTTRINQLSSKFEKDLLRSSENLIVLKNITTTNNGTVILGADRTTFVFGKVSATSHFNIPVDFSTLQVGTRLTYSFNARSNFVLKDMLLTASANLKVVRVLVGDTEQTTVTNSKITFNSSLAVNKYHSITILFEVILANAGTVQLGNSFNGTDQTFNVDIQYPMLSTGGKGVGWRLSNADSEIYKVYTDAQITQYSQTVANQFQAVAETQTAMQTTIETNRNKAATDIATVTKSISDNDQAYAQQFTTLSARFTTYKGNGNNLLSYETSVGEKLAMFTNSVGLEITSTEIVNANYSKTTFKASTARSSFTLRVNLDENFSTLPEVLFSLYLSNLVPINITVSGVLTTLASASVDNRLVGLPTATYVDLTIVTPTGANIAAGTNILSINRLMVEQSTSRIPSVWVAGSKGIGTVIESNSLELKESIADAKSTLNRRIDSMESNFNGRITGGGNIWTITDNLVNTNTITGNLTALIVDKTIDYLTIKSNVAQTNAAYKIANTSVVPNIQVVPNTTYSLSFKVRSTVATTMDIEVINGTVTPFKPTTVNLTTNTQLLTYSIKFTGSSSFETSIKLIFPSLVLNSVIHISELMFQEGPGTQYTKAVPYLERSIVATKANIEDHKATYASDKESTATRLNQMSTEYKSSGGSVLVDNTTSNPTSWWSGEKPDLKDNFVTVTGAPSGYTAFTKTNSVADKVLDDIYNLTTVPSSIAYTVSVYIKRVVGSLGRCYITTGIRLNSSPTSAIIRSQNIDVTSQVPANGTWVNVKVTVPASGANIPQKYFGFRLNVEAATAGAASYIQGYLVTPVVTSANLDGTVATKANIDDLSKAVSDANGASASRVQKLESDMVAVDGKTDTKIATALTTYYTKTEADSAITGKVSEYDASLVIGGANLVMNTTEEKQGWFWLFVEPLTEVLHPGVYTISYDLEHIDGASNGSGVGFRDPIADTYKYVWFPDEVTGHKTTTVHLDSYGFTHFAIYVNSEVKIKNVKLERGSKATSWSPAPKEIKDALHSNANAIQTVNAEVARVNGEVVATATSVSSLSSNVGLLQGSINEVRQTVTNNQESTNTLVTSLRSGMADADDVSMMMRNATVLHEDLNFRDGYNGVTIYNHQANGALACNFTDKLPDNPVASTRQLQFVHSGGATNPDLGGYFQVTFSRANGVFLVKFVAKLPVGFSFLLAANAYGDGANSYFIGSSEGTGKFKTYYAVYRCGATGDFSSIGFVYVNGQHPTPENPLIWYLASSTMYDCLDSKISPDSVVNGIAEAKSTASTAVNKAEATALIAQELRSALDETNATISTKYITKADANTAITGKVEEFSSSLEVGGVNRYNHLAPVIEYYEGVVLQLNHEEAPNGFFITGQSSQTGTTRINNVITEKGWWTVSFYIRGSQSVTAGFMLDICDTSRVRVASNADNTWKRITHTAYVDRVDGVYNFVDIEDVDWAYVYVKDFKIEKGNVATAWTPYPKILEDSVANIKNTYVTESKLNSSIAAQSTEITSKLSRMTEDNLLYNPDFRLGSLKGWTAGSYLDSYTVLHIEAGHYLDTYAVNAGLSKTIAVHSSGVSSGYVEIAQQATVKENRRYQVSCYVGAHRADVVVFCYFYRADGSLISNSPTWEQQQRVKANEAVGGKNLYDYGRIYQNVTTPTGTETLAIVIRRLGGNDAYMFVTRAQVVEIFDDNLVPWQSSAVQDNATIKETTKSINGIEAVKTVTIDNNGVMSGYGLISELKNGQVTSSFGVNADTFFIGSPASNKKPFIVTSYPRDINGVSYPAGTWMDVALIANATIGTAKIADLAVTNAKILDATIESAKIKTIKADKIEIGNPLVGPITSAMVTGTSLTNAANMFNGTVAANAAFATYGTGTQSDTTGAEINYIQVDVGSTVSMPEVRFFFRGSTGRKTYIKLKASVDGVNWDYIMGSTAKWETIDDMPPGPNSDYSTVTIQASFSWYGVKPYRYLRIYGNGSSASATNEIVAIIGNASGSVTKIGSEGILTNSITADKLNVTELSAISANLGTIKVDTANIEDLAVTTANIEDLAITTAKIGDLQVDTLKIKDRAVTVPITIEKTGISPAEDQYQTGQYHTVNADNWFTASITGLSANSSVIIFISGVYNAYTVTTAHHPSKTYAVSSTSLDLKVNGNIIRSVPSSGSGTTYSTSQYGSSQESLSVFMAETDSNGNINISFSSVHSGNVNVKNMTFRYGYSATNAIIHILELKK